MEIDRLMERLDDERCGLFFLAGLDKGNAGEDVLTIHTATGVLTEKHRTFILAEANALGRPLRVQFRYHSSSELYAPETLESFSRMFDHDRIISDPTGAFSRVSKLMQLARAIRAEFGGLAGQLLWQNQASRLLIVADRNDETPKMLEKKIQTLIDEIGCTDLKKVIRSVVVGTAVQGNRYTPIDAVSYAASRPVPRPKTLLAKVSSLVALIGLGTLAAAQAKTPAENLSGEVFLPGITALADLTTLGENSYGLRNHYQAIGALRLYFRETETANMRPFNIAANSTGNCLPKRIECPEGW